MVPMTRKAVAITMIALAVVIGLWDVWLAFFDNHDYNTISSIMAAFPLWAQQVVVFAFGVLVGHFWPTQRKPE